MAEKKQYRKPIITPEFRALYPNIFTPESEGARKGKFTVKASFEAEPTVLVEELLATAADAEREHKLPGLVKALEAHRKAGWPHQPFQVFVDGKAYGVPIRAGKGDWGHTLNATFATKDKPVVVGPNKVDGKFPHITDPGRIYGGVVLKAQIVCSFYSGSGIGQGFNWYLNSIQIIRDGKPVGREAGQAFEEVSPDELEF